MREHLLKHLLLLTLFSVLCSSVASAQLSDPGTQKWTEKDGRTMQARLLQYEPSTKTLRFSTDSESLPYETLFRDLNLAGKIQAICHPNFFNPAQYSFNDFGILSTIAAGIWALVVGIAIAAVFLLAYITASKLVMGKNSIRYKITGFIRLFLIYLFFFILGISAVIGCFILLKNQPNIAKSAAGLSATLVTALAFFVNIKHYKKYYHTSTLRSVMLFFVYAVAIVVFTALFGGAISGIAYAGYENLPNFTDSLLSNLILKPLGLI